jgi:hypothetical protein
VNSDIEEGRGGNKENCRRRRKERSRKKKNKTGKEEEKHQKRPSENDNSRWNDNIKMYLREMGYKDMGWTQTVVGRLADDDVENWSSVRINFFTS